MERKGTVCSFTEEANEILETWLDDIRLQEFSLGDCPEAGTRFPVTQEFMVSAIVAERNGEAPPHPARQYFADALCKSIERMVGMLASRYSTTCIEHQEDLAQECFQRIWKKLHTYDSKRAKFSTWAWRLCSNVLNREYRRSQKLTSHLVSHPDEDMERKPAEETHYGAILSCEFADAVRELGEKYPEWKTFVYALLGNPEDKTIPGGVCVAHAALVSEVGRGTAMNFYHQKVQPFMQKRFR